MKGSSVKGTSKYVVGPIARFDQKNEMFKRALWDPQFQRARERFHSVNYPKDKNGYSHEDLALKEAAWYIERTFARGNAIHNSGMYSWEGQPGGSRIPPDLKLQVNDPAKMSENVKKVATLFGASQAGIGELDRRWVYSHSFNRDTHEHKEFEVPEEYKYVIVLIFEMDYELVKASPTWLMAGTEGKAYSTMPFTASMLAQFIRGLGYKAIPSGNWHAPTKDTTSYVRVKDSLASGTGGR